MPHAAAELEQTDSRDDPDGILTADRAMVAVLRTLRQVAPTDLPVLIQGETGTGKELIARALCRSSNRTSGAFLVLNCAVVPPSLIASELFGDVHGASRAADADRVGLVGTAHGGTLFLDEIGDLPADLQPNLLRVLQSGEFTRVGSAQPETADIRLIAATSRDLQRDVEKGRFRSDLFDRLSAVTLKLPPLRERPHDIYLLAPYFLRRYAARKGTEAPTLDLAALIALSNYTFPENIRELESEMARLVAVSPPGATLGPEALNERMRVQAPEQHDPPRPPMPLAEARSMSADLLGIGREGLRTKMQRFGLAQDSDS